MERKCWKEKVENRKWQWNKIKREEKIWISKSLKFILLAHDSTNHEKISLPTWPEK